MQVLHPLVPILVGKHLEHLWAASSASSRVSKRGSILGGGGASGRTGAALGTLLALSSLAAASLSLRMKALSRWEIVWIDTCVGASGNSSYTYEYAYD